MSEAILIFGPPGTGKTTACLQAIERWAKDTDLDQIAYVTFTKAAAQEALTRMGVDEHEKQELWMRTLHSAAFKILGMTKDSVVTSAWMREFGEKIGMEVGFEEGETTDEEVADAILGLRKSARSRKPGTVYQGMFGLSRLLCGTVEELDAVHKEPHPDAFSCSEPPDDYCPGTYEAFVAAYEREKTLDGKRDFVDMLELILRHKPKLPDWRYAVCDECQDAPPLQNAIQDHLFVNRCEVTIRSGDDDQAIFSWMGARAQDFLAYRSTSTVIHLTQTHRFGQALADYSARIIQRVAEREPKVVNGLPGKVTTISHLDSLPLEAVRAVEGSGLILHRHIRGCHEIARRLIDAGIPFMNERGANPLSKKHEQGILAFRAWRRVCDGATIDADDLRALVEHVPSMKLIDGVKVRLVVHGVKKLARGLAPKEEILPEDLPQYLAPALLKAAAERDPAHLKIFFYDYYDRLVTAGFDLRDRPKVTIVTIHGSKGREAETVWLFSETYPKAFERGMDNEHRLAYVGVTRARSHLFIVHEQLYGTWTRPYPYPE